MPTSPSSATAAGPVARWFRRLRWALTGLCLLAALGWGAQWVWLGRQTVAVPVDWLAFWGGERLEGHARTCVPLKPGGAYKPELLPVDADGAYSVRSAAEWGDLGQWWPGPHGGLDWTIAAWSRLGTNAAQWPAFAFLVAGGSTYPHDWFLMRKRGEVGVVMGTAAPSDRQVPPWEFTAPFEETPDAWVHLAASYDSRSHEVILYAAGREVGRRVRPHPDLWPTSTLRLGGDPFVADQPPVLRQVDDLALFNRPLTPAEVAALAETGRGGAARVLDQLAQRRAMSAAAATALPWVLCLGPLLWVVPWLVQWWWRLVRGLPAGQRRALVPVAVVLLVGAAVTAGTTGTALRWMRSAAERRLASSATQFREAVDAHYEKLMATLFLLRTQLPATGQITVPVWNQALAGLNREDASLAWPLGYAEYVRPGERAGHEARWRQQWNHLYRIHSVSPEEPPVPGAATNAALPVVILKPSHGAPLRHPAGQWYWGRDLLAPNLTAFTNRLLARIALEGLTNRRSAPPAEMFCSAVPGASEPGLMLFLPLPDKAASGDQRRGLLFAGSRAGAFLPSNFGLKVPDFGIRWFWEMNGVPPLLALDSGDLWPKTKEPENPWLRRHETILLYGARLQCDFWTTPEFDADNHRHAPWLIALAGASFTLLTAGFVAVQVRARLNEAEIAGELRASHGKIIWMANRLRL